MLVAACTGQGEWWLEDVASPGDADSGSALAALLVPAYSTSSSAFETIPGATLTFVPRSEGEIWLILLSAQSRSTVAASQISVEARFLVNGVEHGLAGTANMVSDLPVCWWQIYAVSNTVAPQTVEVQLRDAMGIGTMENLRLVAFPLPPAADFQMAETEAQVLVPSGVFTPLAILTFTPATPGQYVVLALTSANEAPGNGSVWARLRLASGELAPPDVVGPLESNRQIWAPMLLARVEALPAATVTLTLEGQSDSGSQDATLAYSRLLAFRADAFASFDRTEDLTVTTTSSTVPRQKSALTTRAPLGRRDYVLIQSFMLRPAVGDAALERGMVSEFRVNGEVATRFERFDVSSGPDATSGYFGAVTTADPLLLENVYYLSNSPALAAEAAESVIYVLGL